MMPLTIEWIAKAEGDFLAVQQLARLRKRPLADAVCFHAQQCVEKLLKALLQESGDPVPKTHDLIALLELCLPGESMLEPLRPRLFHLNRYAVNFRYPGESASLQEARNMMIHCKKVRQTLREILGLEAQIKLRKSRKNS